MIGITSLLNIGSQEVLNLVMEFAVEHVRSEIFKLMDSLSLSR